MICWEYWMRKNIYIYSIFFIESRTHERSFFVEKNYINKKKRIIVDFFPMEFKLFMFKQKNNWKAFLNMRSNILIYIFISTPQFNILLELINLLFLEHI
jgi:hypothetical protein